MSPVAGSAAWLPPALSERRYRIYALGQAISLFGYWIHQIALSWLVYRLTGSVLLLGVAGFVQNIPSLVVPPLAGLLADRLPRVRMVIILQSTLALLAGLVTLLAFLDVRDVRLYLMLAFLMGCVSAAEAPTRQSLIGSIVADPALLPSAIAFHSVMFNLGRMLGPTAGGLLLLALSEAWCFAFNAVSYLAVIIAFWWIALPEQRGSAAGQSLFSALGTTARALKKNPVARNFLPLVAAAGLLAAPYQSLMPHVAGSVLGGGSALLGLLIGSAGAGALTAAGYLSFQRGGQRQLAAVQIAPFALGLALIGFGLSRSVTLSCACLYVTGLSIMFITASTNTLMQLSVEPGWRARVIGVFQMSFGGLNPIGSLIAGAIAARIGIGTTFVLNGCLVLAAGLWMRWRLARSPDERRDLDRVVGG